MKPSAFTENKPGLFWVNTLCISCDTCHSVAPDYFKLTADNDHAYVYLQPNTAQAISQCDEALEQCPVLAIERGAA